MGGPVILDLTPDKGFIHLVIKKGQVGGNGSFVPIPEINNVMGFADRVTADAVAAEILRGGPAIGRDQAAAAVAGKFQTMEWTFDTVPGRFPQTQRRPAVTALIGNAVQSAHLVTKQRQIKSHPPHRHDPRSGDPG